MQSVFGKGIKQTDFEILQHVEDRDIINICLLHKYAYKILKDDAFWCSRFFKRFGRFLEGMNVKKYRGKNNWKDYYIDVRRYLRNPSPYLMSAMAMSFSRLDICVLLQNIKGIENVKEVTRPKYGDEIHRYYTRDGREYGIREGKYLVIDARGDSSLLRFERIYNNDMLILSSQFKNGIKVREETFHERELVKIVKWSVKGAKVLEEITNDRKKIVKGWYISGAKKFESEYFNGRKNGTWKKWNKEGDLTVKYYSLGKSIPFPTTLEDENKMIEYLEKASK